MIGNEQQRDQGVTPSTPLFHVRNRTTMTERKRKIRNFCSELCLIIASCFIISFQFINFYSSFVCFRLNRGQPRLFIGKTAVDLCQEEEKPASDDTVPASSAAHAAVSCNRVSDTVEVTPLTSSCSGEADKSRQLKKKKKKMLDTSSCFPPPSSHTAASFTPVSPRFWLLLFEC